MKQTTQLQLTSFSKQIFGMNVLKPISREVNIKTVARVHKSESDVVIGEREGIPSSD